jgi:hypothetical protein
MEDENNQPYSLGSGFIVADGIVVTNHHVIDSTFGGKVKVIGEERSYRINGVFAKDPLHDLALLDVPELHAPPLSIDITEVMVGDKLYAIGNPLGLEGTLSEGIVSGVREFGKDRILQISAPISPGSSGGAVLNEYGEIVGVAVATLQGGQNLNFAIPSQYVKDLISNKGASEIIKGNKVTEKSFLANLESDKPTDGVLGENFIWDDSTDVTGNFTYSIRNTLKEPIKNVQTLIIFYDQAGKPLDVYTMTYESTTMFDGTVPSGLAKRLHGFVDASIKKLTTGPAKDNPYLYADKPKTKVEIRVLNFDLAN